MKMKKSLICAIAIVMLSAFNLYAAGVVQMVNFQTNTADDGTVWAAEVREWQTFTSSQGMEIMSLAITPTNANNKLRIDVVANVAVDETSGSIPRRLVIGLFDGGEEALAVTPQNITPVTDEYAVAAIPLTYFMTAGTTNTKTFTVKLSADQIYLYGDYYHFNRSTWGNFGGKETSSITITEIEP